MEMKRLFIILIVAMMTLSFTSCEQTTAFEQSPIKGTWEGVTDIPMTLKFDEKNVEYTLCLESYGSQATYFGTYKIKDSIITLKMDSIKKSQRNSRPIVEYVAPEQMPREAVLCGDSAIIYFEYTFRHIY